MTSEPGTAADPSRPNLAGKENPPAKITNAPSVVSKDQRRALQRMEEMGILNKDGTMSYQGWDSLYDLERIEIERGREDYVSPTAGKFISDHSYTTWRLNKLRGVAVEINDFVNRNIYADEDMPIAIEGHDAFYEQNCCPREEGSSQEKTTELLPRIVGKLNKKTTESNPVILIANGGEETRIDDYRLMDLVVEMLEPGSSEIPRINVPFDVRVVQEAARLLDGGEAKQEYPEDVFSHLSEIFDFLLVKVESRPSALTENGLSIHASGAVEGDGIGRGVNFDEFNHQLRHYFGITCEWNEEWTKDELSGQNQKHLFPFQFTGENGEIYHHSNVAKALMDAAQSKARMKMLAQSKSPAADRAKYKGTGGNPPSEEGILIKWRTKEIAKTAHHIEDLKSQPGSHQKALREDREQYIEKYHFDSMMRQAGVLRNSKLIYEESWGYIKIALSNILRGAITYSERERQSILRESIVTSKHVLCALQDCGHPVVWGCGHPDIPSGLLSEGINKGLKQIHPDISIAPLALAVVEDYLTHLISRVTRKAVEVSISDPIPSKVCIQSGHIQTAVWLILPRELAKHAIAEGTKAVNSQLSTLRDPGPPFCVTKVAAIASRVQHMSIPFSLGESNGSVFLTAVVKYMATELLELSGNAARDNKTVWITPRHIVLALYNKEDLYKFSQNAIIREGGGAPSILRSLHRTKEPPVLSETFDEVFVEMIKKSKNKYLVDPRDGLHKCIESDAYPHRFRRLPVLDAACAQDKPGRQTNAIKALNDHQRRVFDTCQQDADLHHESRLDDIRHYQLQTSWHITNRRGFFRLIRDLGHDFNTETDLIFTDEAYVALQTFSETYLVRLYSDAQLCAIPGERTELQPKDLQLARRIRRERS